jgi:hypothetical protein
MQYLYSLGCKDDKVDKILDVWASRIENLKPVEEAILRILSGPKKEPTIVVSLGKVHK